MLTVRPLGALRHAHQEKHVKKDNAVVTVVDTVYAHETHAPEVIVYVNQAGAPVSTVTKNMDIAPTPSSNPVAAPAPVKEAQSDASPSTPDAAPAPPAASSTPAGVLSNIHSLVASPSPSPSPASSPESSGYGVSYSPYTASGACKSQDQVNADFDSIGGGYSMVRIYGTDCNQVSTVLSAAKAHGMKLFAGVFDLGSLNSEIETIISAANGDWSSFDTISIGNELVNSGTASAATVVSAIGTARGLLQAAGYTGKVVTVDTLVAARANPSLCDASDYCAVNCHPFFDGTVPASGSGDFLVNQISTLRAVLSDQSKEIVITETGWPWQGSSNGAAVPSPANQAAAISSIKGAFSSNPSAVILFTTFNDLWKTNSAAQFFAEQYWGFLGYAPSG